MANFFCCWVVLVGVVCGQHGLAVSPPAERAPIHPRVFKLVTCWSSDTEQPVVTEINLDAVRRNRNQFDPDVVTTRGGWVECPRDPGPGFDRYRIVREENEVVTVEFQSNDGGTFTAAANIEFAVETREFREKDAPVKRRVLRVISCTAK